MVTYQLDQVAATEYLQHHMEGSLAHDLTRQFLRKYR